MRERLGSAVPLEMEGSDQIRASVGGSISISPLSDVIALLDPLAFPGGLYSRQQAMTVPTVARSRNVICDTVGVLPLTYWKRTEVTKEDQQLEPLPWMNRPDPNRTTAHIMAWTVDDLLFHARAFWRVTDRYQLASGPGFPKSFERMPFDQVSVRSTTGGTEVSWSRDGGGRQVIPPGDVIDFQGLNEGVLCVAYRAICIALKLDTAAERFADMKLPAGVLRTAQFEPDLSPEMMTEQADDFEERRLTSTTAALNGLIYDNPTWDAESLQLVEARQHQALEVSRHMNMPPWITGSPQGASMTYQNASQARLDLIDFALIGFLSCIEQTLSGPNVVARTNYVRFDTDAWLRNPLLPLNEPKPERTDGTEDGAGLGAAKAREVAELIQKVYLGVGLVLTDEEARRLVTDAGFELPGRLPEGSATRGGQGG